MFFTLFHWFIKITGFLPMLVILRNRIHYEDRAIQGRKIKGGAIVVANHNVLMDFAVLLFTFPFNTLRCVVAEVLYHKNFVLRCFMKMLGTVEVNRHGYDIAFLKKCRKIIERGGIVEIFPEGRLPDKDGNGSLLPFKPGAVYLALETKVPIIPVYNARRGMSTKRGAVIIGKPIYLDELYDESLSKKENIDNMTLVLRQKIIDLGVLLSEKEKEK